MFFQDKSAEIDLVSSETFASPLQVKFKFLEEFTFHLYKLNHLYAVIIVFTHFFMFNLKT